MSRYWIQLLHGVAFEPQAPDPALIDPREDGVEACPNCGKTFFKLVVQHPFDTIAAATEAIDSEEE